MVPDDLRYTAEHEWVRQLDGGRVRIGITHHAQEQLGDVVFVQLPEVGATLAAGDVMGEVESTKSVSELFAPVGGEVTAVNAALEADPGLVNSGPYDDGWMVELLPSGDAAQLLDAAGYRELAEG
ncbi:MAG: glycine cleavage system protein GcvH [Pseudonocardia sp.]